MCSLSNGKRRGKKRMIGRNCNNAHDNQVMGSGSDLHSHPRFRSAAALITAVTLTPDSYLPN